MTSETKNRNQNPNKPKSMKLFKVIASKAGRVVFDDRVQAESPREAREQMKTLMGLQSLSGVVYAVTEICGPAQGEPRRIRGAVSCQQIRQVISAAARPRWSSLRTRRTHP